MDGPTKKSKYRVAYGLISLYFTIQLVAGIVYGIRSEQYSVAVSVIAVLVIVNVGTLGVAPMLVIQGSFSFGSWVWARQQGLVACIRAHKRKLKAPPRTNSTTPGVFISRLAKYGEMKFGKSEEHIRGYCLNMIGSEVYGMCMSTANYRIGNYHKNFNGSDFGCESKSWGVVTDRCQGSCVISRRGRYYGCSNENVLCVWKDPSGPMEIAKGVDIDHILAEMGIMVATRAELPEFLTHQHPGIRRAAKKRADEL